MPYKDPEKRRAAQRRYAKKRVRPPGRKEYMREYRRRSDVKEKRREYYKRPETKKRRLEIRRNNPIYKRRKYLRGKVRNAVIKQSSYISTIHKLIGCDVLTARKHLEAQFEPWMTWDNYGSGRGKWTIDHIERVSSIDIFDEEEVKRIFHYKNMRPLCFIKNSEDRDEGRSL